MSPSHLLFFSLISLFLSCPPSAFAASTRTESSEFWSFWDPHDKNPTRIKFTPSRDSVWLDGESPTGESLRWRYLISDKMPLTKFFAPPEIQRLEKHLGEKFRSGEVYFLMTPGEFDGWFVMVTESGHKYLYIIGPEDEDGQRRFYSAGSTRPKEMCKKALVGPSVH